MMVMGTGVSSFALPINVAAVIAATIRETIVTVAVKERFIVSFLLVGCGIAAECPIAFTSARSMAVTTEHASERSTRVAAAAEQATANVSIVASSADEMGKSVAEIAHQVGHSTQIALEAVAKTQTANATLENLAQTA